MHIADGMITNIRSDKRNTKAANQRAGGNKFTIETQQPHGRSDAGRVGASLAGLAVGGDLAQRTIAYWTTV